MRVDSLSSVVAAFESGRRPKGGVSSETGTIPSLGGEHLKNDGGFRFDNLKYIDEDFFVGLKKGAVKKNDILIVKDGATTGKVSFVGDDFPFEKAAINEHLFALTVDTSKAEPRYVFSFLKSPQGRKEILKDFRGAAIGGISRGFVDLAKIPLPLLDDQKRIAHLLCKVEGMIARRKQHLQQLDDLLKSIFLEMFGDPVRNEKGWEKPPLVDLTTSITDGKHGDCNNDEGSGYFFISAKDIHDGIIDYSKARQILKNEFEEVHRRTNLQANDLVMVNTGATIGKMAIAQSDPKTAMTTFQKSVAVIKPIHEVLNIVYLKALFEIRLKELVKVSSGSAQQNLLLSQMRKIPVMFPPIDLQNQFAAIVEKVESIKSRYQQSLTDLESLYGALSQKAFKGELDLSRVPLPHEKEQRDNFVSITGQMKEFMGEDNGETDLGRKHHAAV